MPSWSQYREIASSRGALAFELYVVESTAAQSPQDVQAVLPQHLEYQKEMEETGRLFLAGPLSDLTGEEMSGGGLIIYRASSMVEARELADSDPMHNSGARTYTLRRWLINEGSISLTMGLATQKINLS
jgi:uncharacterized protein YciI